MPILMTSTLETSCSPSIEASIAFTTFLFLIWIAGHMCKLLTSKIDSYGLIWPLGIATQPFSFHMRQGGVSTKGTQLP